MRYTKYIRIHIKTSRQGVQPMLQYIRIEFKAKTPSRCYWVRNNEREKERTEKEERASIIMNN